ncbi:MAG: hypothetical protein PHE08_11575 [Bacteroidales bacterium]|nr:hypothetical protein [Bacteroidales bacterium]
MKKTLIWIAAIIITLGSSVYQRLTGPTHPLRIKTELNGSEYDLKLTRSATIGKDCEVNVPNNSEFNRALLIFHKYPGNFETDTIEMQLKDNNYTAVLPEQPPAAKIQYYISLYKNDLEVFNNSKNTAIIRFKGDVPAAVLIPHILAMFISMLFAIVSLLMAVSNIGNYKLMSYLTFGSLVLGGFILGPIIQYYAFGDAWTGWPIGKDLTDNKTLIAVIFWIIAIVLNVKKDRKWTIIVAAIIMIIIFSIPHSAGGSEFNYESGTIETGL